MPDYPYIIDPFTQVYEKIWETLTNAPEVSRRVKPVNRIMRTGQRVGPFRDTVTAADLPELDVVPAGGEANPFQTSTSGQFLQMFDVQVSAGGMSLDRSQLFPLKWAVLKAVARAGDTLGLDFVKSVRITDMAEGPTLRDERQAVGWQAIIRVQVVLFITRVHLVATEN